ncbi:hypothetical protein [Paraferrimonas sp. SM1919]|uniref:hypothetical protein n=1 Tax=Paraferrimonas sp. SM1919 TaxID=2662263 RepID=UPI0013D16A5D|nr:hypothetical protein [Paraferrimonas sp. SM1919]
MKKILSKALKVNKDISHAKMQRETRELRRLETLIDTVFALMIISIVFNEPLPDNLEQDQIIAFITDRAYHMLMSAIGIVVAFVYWFQSNLLLGNLIRTDTPHAIISISQIFMILLYLMTLHYGIILGNEPIILAAQSLAATLVGLTAAAAWWYASYQRRLLTPEACNHDVAALRLRVIAEPLTGIFTLCMAFISPSFWIISWLSYPIFIQLLRPRISH